MPDLQGIRREALTDVINDIKVMEQVCYSGKKYENVDCEDCTSYGICHVVFDAKTPKLILGKLKEEGII